MSVDDVEEFTDSVDGELVHALQRDAAVTARERIERIQRRGKRYDQGSTVRIQPLRYGDVGRLLRAGIIDLGRCTRIVGES